MHSITNRLKIIANFLKNWTTYCSYSNTTFTTINHIKEIQLHKYISIPKTFDLIHAFTIYILPSIIIIFSFVQMVLPKLLTKYALASHNICKRKLAASENLLYEFYFKRNWYIIMHFVTLIFLFRWWKCAQLHFFQYFMVKQRNRDIESTFCDALTYIVPSWKMPKSIISKCIKT